MRIPETNGFEVVIQTFESMYNKDLPGAKFKIGDRVKESWDIAEDIPPMVSTITGVNCADEEPGTGKMIFEYSLDNRRLKIWWEDELKKVGNK